MKAPVTWSPATADDLADTWVRVRSSVDDLAVDPTARTLRRVAGGFLIAAVMLAALGILTGAWAWFVVAAAITIGPIAIAASLRAGLLVSRRGVRVVTLTRAHDFAWADVAFELEAVPSSWIEWLVVSDRSGREFGVRDFSRKMAPGQASPGYSGELSDLSSPAARRGAALEALIILLEQLRTELA